jgi:hypothetical protein
MPFETYKQVTMDRYKRNQIEEAISRTIGERSAKPSSGLRTRLKRLLDMDRGLKRAARSSDPERANYAFYSSDAPGKGSEVLFSNYDVFALLMGMRMLQHGWPQNFVVTTLRRIRHELEARHTEIFQVNSPNVARQEPQAGDLAIGNPASPFLLIVSDDKTVDRSQKGPYAQIFDNQEDAFRFQMKKAGRSCSWFELDTLARTLRTNLIGSLPRQRGRSS